MIPSRKRAERLRKELDGVPPELRNHLLAQAVVGPSRVPGASVARMLSSLLLDSMVLILVVTMVIRLSCQFQVCHKDPLGPCLNAHTRAAAEVLLLGHDGSSELGGVEVSAVASGGGGAGA
ncbi:hypothetical protein V6U80_21610 [Micromonospora sp. CPCC 205543]